MSKFGMWSFYTPTPYLLHSFLTNTRNYHSNVFVYGKVDLTSTDGSYVCYKWRLNSGDSTEFSLPARNPIWSSTSHGRHHGVSVTGMEKSSGRFRACMCNYLPNEKKNSWAFRPVLNERLFFSCTWACAEKNPFFWPKYFTRLHTRGWE
jgi:hypothetical protein